MPFLSSFASLLLLPVGPVRLSSVCLLVPLVLLCCSRPSRVLLSAPLPSLWFACFLFVLLSACAVCPSSVCLLVPLVLLCCSPPLRPAVVLFPLSSLVCLRAVPPFFGLGLLVRPCPWSDPVPSCTTPLALSAWQSVSSAVGLWPKGFSVDSNLGLLALLAHPGAGSDRQGDC